MSGFTILAIGFGLVVAAVAVISPFYEFPRKG